jgi:hypothetical protein
MHLDRVAVVDDADVLEIEGPVLVVGEEIRRALAAAAALASASAAAREHGDDER